MKILLQINDNVLMMALIFVLLNEMKKKKHQPTRNGINKL